MLLSSASLPSLPELNIDITRIPITIKRVKVSAHSHTCVDLPNYPCAACLETESSSQTSYHIVLKQNRKYERFKIKVKSETVVSAPRHPELEGAPLDYVVWWV